MFSVNTDRRSPEKTGEVGRAGGGGADAERTYNIPQQTGWINRHGFLLRTEDPCRHVARNRVSIQSSIASRFSKNRCRLHNLRCFLGNAVRLSFVQGGTMYFLLYKLLEVLDKTLGRGQGLLDQGTPYRPLGEVKALAEIAKLRSDVDNLKKV